MLAQTTTHATLLARVAAGQDPIAWREFCDRYEELIRGFAHRRGVTGADADDLTQDVLLSLTKAMPGFAYDPAKGKFRSYLKTTVIRAIAARFRQKSHATPLEPLEASSRVDGALAETSDDEAAWESQWRQYHLRQAMKSVRPKFSDQDWEAFEAYATQGKGAATVARDLGLTLDQVYQAKSRILKSLGAQIALQVEDEG